MELAARRTGWRRQLASSMEHFFFYRTERLRPRLNAPAAHSRSTVQLSCAIVIGMAPRIAAPREAAHVLPLIVVSAIGASSSWTTFLGRSLRRQLVIARIGSRLGDVVPLHRLLARSSATRRLPTAVKSSPGGHGSLPSRPLWVRLCGRSAASPDKAGAATFWNFVAWRGTLAVVYSIDPGSCGFSPRFLVLFITRASERTDLRIVQHFRAESSRPSTAAARRPSQRRMAVGAPRDCGGARSAGVAAWADFIRGPGRVDHRDGGHNAFGAFFVAKSSRAVTWWYYLRRPRGLAPQSRARQRLNRAFREAGRPDAVRAAILSGVPCQTSSRDHLR